MPEPEWRRIYGFRVVISAPSAGPPPPPRPLRARLAGFAGVLFILAGLVTVGVALASQVHAPQPSASAAGTIGGRGPALDPSPPVSVSIPAIGVSSDLLDLGLNPTARWRCPP